MEDGMGISAIDNVITLAQQFFPEAEQKKGDALTKIFPAVVLPPADPSRPFEYYSMTARVAVNKVDRWSYLTPVERGECEEFVRLDNVFVRQLRLGLAVGAVAGGGGRALNTYLGNQNFDANKILGAIASGAMLGAVTVWYFSRYDPSKLRNCDRMQNDRLRAAARVVYDAAKNTQERIATYAVSAETMAAARPSVFGLFARDAADAAKVGAAVVVGAASAALFIAVFRAMPSAMSGASSAGFGAGIMPSADSYDRNIL